ncbi:SUKH-3 domain-containing protein [Streptomyces sp. NBC_00250]|uniref:SUKH-3 domain-containing protein n=1 Tax=Streptomyces sp. NBC_00250 TaxID=2903641 RepID=UPI002E295C5B|nr:SUKH-3 domain-containing protein [Streptomyces sp. NBC_00250]
MPHLNTPEDVDAWFRDHGWFPGRDVAGTVPAMVDEITGQYREAGFPVEPFEAATAFLAEHGGLRLTIDAAREDYLYFTPYLGFRSAPAEVAELSRELGVRLFPVGLDGSEGSPVLIDERGRFFFVHHTGAYYMGADKHEAMIGLAHAPMQDAEDFYV